MSKEMTPAKKGRVTKLSQKSVNDLINIILRKDDVERKQQERIIELQKICSAKISKYCTLDEKYQKALKTIEDFEKKQVKIVSNNNLLAEEIDNLRDNNSLLYRTCLGLGMVLVILIFVLFLL